MELGSPALVDNFEFHRHVADKAGRLMEYFFASPPRSQKTWRGLIVMQLAAERREVSPDLIKQFQAAEWGRRSSNNCLLELFPLPAPKSSQWNYSAWSSIDYLVTKPRYIQALAPRRVRLLRSAVAQHRPKAVIFYSNTYVSYWSEIAGVDFEALPERTLSWNSKERELTARIASNNGTVLVNCFHPAYQALNTEYFETIGNEIAGARTSD